MSSVQDNTPVFREPSNRRQQDPQLSPSEQPQTVQQPPAPPQLRGPSDSLQVSSPEAPREYPSPRSSPFLDPLPGSPDSQPPRRGISTGTNSVTLVNHPGVIGNPNIDPNVQNPSAITERSQNQPAPVSDQHPPFMYNTIQGNTVVPTQLPDDGVHGGGSFLRRICIPKPSAAHHPQQGRDGNRRPPEHTLPLTVWDRLEHTRELAEHERVKYKAKGRREGIMINGAIGLQVIVGAITTGVAAGSKNIGSSVAVLGGISTALASYLAKARGSGEPETSNLRARELNTFIREVDAFMLDNGYKPGSEFDQQIIEYRNRFEAIIKTDGESSPNRPGYASHARGQGQQQMGGTYGGGQSHAGSAQLSEKEQMLRDEKKISGAV